MQTMTRQPADKKQYLSQESKRILSIALLIPAGMLCVTLLFILGKGM